MDARQWPIQTNRPILPRRVPVQSRGTPCRILAAFSITLLFKRRSDAARSRSPGSLQWLSPTSQLLAYLRPFWRVSLTTLQTTTAASGQCVPTVIVAALSFPLAASWALSRLPGFSVVSRLWAPLIALALQARHGRAWFCPPSELLPSSRPVAFLPCPLRISAFTSVSSLATLRRARCPSALLARPLVHHPARSCPPMVAGATQPAGH